MAVYKVIQDIEAEDKLLGPLTLKGLIYAGIAVIFGFLNFKLVTSGAPIFIKIPFMVVISMPMALFGILASPLGRDQPTEVWLLAHLKFFLKPRQRIWNQSGISQLVTITVPKRLERQLTKGYSQVEVQSRLKALANTLDSRGWVVKNVNVNLNTQPDYVTSTEQTSDRLITASTMVREVPEIEVQPSDDILDEQNNDTAHKFQSMMLAAEEKRKDELSKKINEARAQAKAAPVKELPSAETTASVRKDTQLQSPLPLAEPMAVMGTTIITPGQVVPINPTKPDSTSTTVSPEQQLLDRLHREQAALASISRQPPPIVQIHGGKVINPDGTMTSGAQTDKLKLAQSGNDFSVATIAELANRPTKS